MEALAVDGRQELDLKVIEPRLRALSRKKDVCSRWVLPSQGFRRVIFKESMETWARLWCPMALVKYQH